MATDLDRNAGDVQKCRKCKKNTGKYMMRNELQCRDCFDKYIRLKCVKRMESYRIRPSENGILTFLLPLSFGVSSATLLFLLDSQLRNQRERVTRTRYKLKILHMDESVMEPSPFLADHLEAFKKEFPDAGEYMNCKLEDIYDFKEGKNVLGEKDTDVTNKEAIQKLMLALPTPTSRMDMAHILRTRLIVVIAKRENCEGILWGDTTTKLAQKTLAETAKGRGFSLPWQMSDGEHPYGLKFLYPLRDLLKKELVTYTTEILDPPLIRLCTSYSSKHTVEEATSARNITIDELMMQFFESMEQKFPHIVSNVTKTADRLAAVDEKATACRICGLPGDGGGGGLILGSTENGGSSDGMCYGCMRSTLGATEYTWPL